MARSPDCSARTKLISSSAAESAAAALAASVNTPVVLIGGVRSLETANAVLAKTAIQYIALSRPLIREPNLVSRWLADDHRPSSCISCNACYRTHAHACIFAARL